MKRVLFPLSSRTGSLLLESMLFGHVGNTLSDKECPMKSDTLPDVDIWTHVSPSARIVEDAIWGRPIISQPEVYTIVPPAILDPSFYNHLSPSDDWRFVYLIRDPRNRLASREACVRNAYEQTNQELTEEMAEAYFRTECTVVANEYHSISQMLSDERFLTVKFEDLIADPVECFVNIFKFCELDVDVTVCKRIVRQQTKRFVNSAFADKGRDVNNRWLSWSLEKRAYFAGATNEALTQFGYESDDTWVTK